LPSGTVPMVIGNISFKSLPVKNGTGTTTCRKHLVI
jgi:hypothetical protein